jgi:alkylhydroperoxidase family enzyme
MQRSTRFPKNTESWPTLNRHIGSTSFRHAASLVVWMKHGLKFRKQMLAHTPPLLQLAARWAGTQFSSLELGHKHRELVILLTGAMQECEYEIVQHLAPARLVI